MHSISKRGDSKECLALSMAANAEALACSALALYKTIDFIYAPKKDGSHSIGAEAALWSIAAVLQWTALYKNNSADKEKNAFDDAYIILIKQLDIIIGRPAKRV
jgi:hypothetical protein